MKRVALLLAVGTALAQGGEPLRVGGSEKLYDWPLEARNRVENGGFEAVYGTGAPIGWKLAEAQHFQSTTAEKRTGARSLELKNSHLARYTPAATQALRLEPGWYDLSGWIRGEAAGGNTPTAGGRLSVSWSNTQRVSTAVVRGTTPWTRVERGLFPVLPGESHRVSIGAYGKPDGVLYFDDIEVRRRVPPAIEGFLLFPNYRGLLFDDGESVIRMAVLVRPEEVGLPLAGLRVRIILESDSGVPAMPPSESLPSDGSVVMTVEAKSLEVGSYRLRLQLLNRADGRVLSEYPAYRVTKASGASRKSLRAWIDADNVFVLDGKRRFVLGIYDTGGYSNGTKAYDERLDAIAQAPLDLYINYRLGGAPTSSLEALMIALKWRGMAYLHTVNSWYPGHANEPKQSSCGGQAAVTGLEAFTSCMARELGGQPGFAGWYTADEQLASAAEKVFAQYKTLREAAPGGVTFIAQNAPRELVMWRDVTDVLGVDPYPIFNIPEGRLSPLEMVTDWVESAQHAVQRSRPVWAVIQYFQFGSKGHWPTYDELRTMSYMAIVAGAKGLFYWSYGAKGLAWVKDPVLKADLWRRLVKVTKEIKSLEPALLAPDATDVIASQTPQGIIRLLAKRQGEVRLVIAVNNSNQTAAATIRLAQAGSRVTVVGEGRSIVLESGVTLSDVFPPYATHVYSIEPEKSARR
jgi:hypothetical protein